MIHTRTFRRSAVVVAVASALALLAASCSSGGDTQADGEDGATPGAPAAEAAPLDFSATQLSGEPFEGSELEGADTVLWFWAPWCTSCRAEAPDVVEAAGDFEGSVEIVGVPGRGEVAEMDGFVADTGTGSLRHVVDEDGAIWRDYGIIGQPAFAFVDDDGAAEVFVGGLGYEQLTARMQELADS